MPDKSQKFGQVAMAQARKLKELIYTLNNTTIGDLRLRVINNEEDIVTLDDRIDTLQNSINTISDSIEILNTNISINNTKLNTIATVIEIEFEDDGTLKVVT